MSHDPTPSEDVSFDIAHDGEYVDILLPCAPVARDHVARVSVGRLAEAVAVARSRQLGVDARGDL